MTRVPSAANDAAYRAIRARATLRSDTLRLRFRRSTYHESARRGSTSANHRPSQRPCSAIEGLVEAGETGVAHPGLAGDFSECSQMHAVVGPQPVTFRKLASLATQGRRDVDGEILGQSVSKATTVAPSTSLRTASLPGSAT